jgi:hypothetical protein
MDNLYLNMYIIMNILLLDKTNHIFPLNMHFLVFLKSGISKKNS